MELVGMPDAHPDGGLTSLHVKAHTKSERDLLLALAWALRAGIEIKIRDRDGYMAYFPDR